MIFYKHFIGDYQRDTGHLSLTEHGAYRLLLDAYYATEKPLPADERRLFRLLSATDPEEHQAIRTVLADFWAETANGWVNARAEAEIAKAEERAERARENGRKGGRPRTRENNHEKTHPVSRPDINGKPIAITSHSQSQTPEPKPQSEPEKDSGTERALPLALAGGPPKGWPGMETKTGPTWHAYATAYAERYGANPVWNASVAGGIAQLIKRVGAEDAPAIAAFYVGSNSRWYVEKGHSVPCMLNDAEKLRTEWATGKRVTGARARQIDRTATNFDNARAADEILAERKRTATRRASP